MDHPAGEKINAFAAKFTGKALRAGDPDYDSSRAIWNGAIDRKPAVIARCARRWRGRGGACVSPATAISKSQCAEAGTITLGHAVGDGGVMIHLGAMNEVSVDPAARRVKCGGGVTWGDTRCGDAAAMGSRRRAASSATRAWRGSRSAAGSAG